KFYDCATAPSPRRVRIFIAEKGVEIPVVQVDLRSGEQLGEAFRAKNPRCTVPVLELDDGTCLTETVAICDYLDSVYPQPSLMGRTPKERALVLQWNHWIEDLGFLSVAEVLRNSFPGFKDRALPGPDAFEQIPALAERGRRRIGQFWALLDRQLGANAWVAGDAFTMVDISALVVCDFAQRVKLAMPEECAALRAWHGRAAARPSSSGSVL
ncbi:MAG: glutathione S-transferase, partial [Rhodocyclales bacterium CG17_big_fil_post_rev_8_21_14_2_50_68_7]